MTMLNRVRVREAHFLVSVPPPNGDTGFWEYEIVAVPRAAGNVAQVRNQISGMKGMKPLGEFPIDRVSEKTMLALAQELAAREAERPAKGKGKPKAPRTRATEVHFLAELDGTDAAGGRRVCEVIIRPGHMMGEELQPDGRVFWKPVAEPYTASVRRKTAAGKGGWFDVAVSNYGPAEAGRAALAVADRISWAAPKSKPPSTNTLPGYSEPSCTKCRKSIGKMATCCRFPPDPTVHLCCSRCMGKVYVDQVQHEHVHPTPHHLLKGHLPVHSTPPTPCIDGTSCGKCNKPIKDTHYTCGWIPTNQIMVFCPSCWSKATLHDGWRAQLDLD
jgi:hypothetical protein